MIVRDGRVLMVHERSRRSGGGEWWTLPGGGLRPGETAEEALRREVFEETGLVVSAARYVLEMPYPSGMTSVFTVSVADGEPRVGHDDGFGPEQIGVDWLPVPELPIETSGVPVPPLMVVLPTISGQSAMSTQAPPASTPTQTATSGPAALEQAVSGQTDRAEPGTVSRSASVEGPAGDASTVADRGDVSTVVDSGDVSTVVDRGDASTVADSGDVSIVADRGDVSTVADSGIGDGRNGSATARRRSTTK